MDSIVRRISRSRSRITRARNSAHSPKRGPRVIALARQRRGAHNIVGPVRHAPVLRLERRARALREIGIHIRPAHPIQHKAVNRVVLHNLTDDVQQPLAHFGVQRVHEHSDALCVRFSDGLQNRLRLQSQPDAERTHPFQAQRGLPVGDQNPAVFGGRQRARHELPVDDCLHAQVVCQDGVCPSAPCRGRRRGVAPIGGDSVRRRGGVEAVQVVARPIGQHQRAPTRVGDHLPVGVLVGGTRVEHLVPFR
jgi:hypothetical protein